MAEQVWWRRYIKRGGKISLRIRDYTEPGAPPFRCVKSGIFGDTACQVISFVETHRSAFPSRDGGRIGVTRTRA